MSFLRKPRLTWRKQESRKKVRINIDSHFNGNDNIKHSNLFRISSFGLRIFPILIIIYFVGREFYSSAFFQKRDRVNVVFSEEKIGFYSLGLTDNVNYFLSFFPDLEAAVPGGYGYYRLGALAKLTSLERSLDLFKKTYSTLTSSFVDFYFYPSASSDKIEIFFGKEKKDFLRPRFYLIFFGKSNALFFDRLFLYLQFLGKTEGQFKTITSIPTKKEGNRVIFSSKDFFESYQGIFYKRTYRTEQRNVQIIYTKSYKTAQLLGQILEGEGIRVVDLSQTGEKTKECEIVEDKKKFTETAKSLSQFLGCQLVKGKTEAYDIMLKLGEVEEKWEIE
ncbi:hypothetical protein A3F58_03940 [Candidatus Roizmanbacteria bacterium RIFCSPHIGHO2_12_FULL_37_9b]|nr:MAG: hypothetical protein A3F58_03940 [Candidatus Roizmanbacteria bacterium RIFCSPHIGHO2_12_FULL_37_9b]